MRGSDTRTRLKALAPTLDPNTLITLAEMYDAEVLLGTESENPIAIDKTTRISLEQGATLRQLMMDSSASRSLEVGFAYGFSTLWMLDALRKQPKALHVAIDPFEKSRYHGIGLKQVDKIRFEGNFRWLQNFSSHALSDLIRQGEKFDFIYIDGNHRFDDVIVDFYLCDQLAHPNALIVLDDMWMPSIRAAGSFIIENRSYTVEQQPVANILALRKVRNDDRGWTHFRRFHVTADWQPNRFYVKAPLKTRVNRLIGGWIPEKYHKAVRQLIPSWWAERNPYRH
jgi:predicted O-methyltransferase YrrM